MKDKPVLPVLYSEPYPECGRAFGDHAEQPPSNDRPLLLKQIESGELTDIEFDAKVYTFGANRNHLTFYEKDLPSLAVSFTGKPFLRDHNTFEIAARDGTIVTSALVGADHDPPSIKQHVKLTTRRGMTDYVEGRIDRFSIAWDYDDIHCSICKSSWFTCNHVPGRKYKVEASRDSPDRICELIFTNPKGKETSAVNAPAVDGTAILAQLTTFKEHNMSDIQQNPHETSDPADEVQNKLAENSQAMAAFLGEQERQAKLQDQISVSDKILAEQCKYLLTSALAASRLPEVTQARLRKSFEGKSFEPAALQTAIEDARAEVSALTGGLSIQGPGRIHGMSSSEDQLQAAFDDLLGAPRDADKVGLKVPRLSGIREAYFMLTGDYDLHGGFDPIHAQLATTADFTGLVKNALNKVIVGSFEKMGRAGYDWWKSIVRTEHFENLNSITGTLVGTIGSLPSVAEQGEYTELAVGDSPETASFTKYGGYLPLTLEAIDRDETRKLRLYAIELGNAAMRNISEQIAYIFTQSSGAGPTMADGGALFNATAVTSATGHANLLTVALAAAQWDVVAKAVYDQPMLIKQAVGYYGTGKKQAIEPRFCLIPRALRKTAFDAFLNAWDVTANVHADNLLKGNVVPLVVPEWTDATDWAAVCDPDIAPSIILGERFGLVPEVYIAGRETDPAVFMNDEHRLKVRQFLALCVGDFRPLHKSNVAG
jgi:hypothetical protein